MDTLSLMMMFTCFQQVPAINVERNHPGTGCCIGENGNMFQERQTINLTSGLQVSCFGGDWHQTVSVQAIQETNSSKVIPETSSTEVIPETSSTEVIPETSSTEEPNDLGKK